MPAVIDVRKLHKRYGDTVAVDDISFGILGPNGAGKTTTVECIAEAFNRGLLTPRTPERP